MRLRRRLQPPRLANAHIGPRGRAFSYCPGPGRRGVRSRRVRREHRHAPRRFRRPASMVSHVAALNNDVPSAGCAGQSGADDVSAASASTCNDLSFAHAIRRGRIAAARPSARFGGAPPRGELDAFARRPSLTAQRNELPRARHRSRRKNRLWRGSATPTSEHFAHPARGKVLIRRSAARSVFSLSRGPGGPRDAFAFAGSSPHGERVGVRGRSSHIRRALPLTPALSPPQERGEGARPSLSRPCGINIHGVPLWDNGGRGGGGGRRLARQVLGVGGALRSDDKDAACWPPRPNSRPGRQRHRCSRRPVSGRCRESARRAGRPSPHASPPHDGCRAHPPPRLGRPAAHAAQECSRPRCGSTTMRAAEARAWPQRSQR